MSPPSGASLTATGLTRSHGAFVVLDGVSVVVGPRSRIGVVGPNGVGKTTLLRLLAGLEQPDSGKLVLAPPALSVGYLPQETVARPGESLGAYLARRTGVAGAEVELEEAAARLAAFGAYTVTAALLAHASPGAIVMHCLPAYRGKEIDSDVLDGPQSVVWDEAENRRHVQKAVLTWLLEVAP